VDAGFGAIVPSPPLRVSSRQVSPPHASWASRSATAVLDWVNQRPRPLGVYVFADDEDTAARILEATTPVTPQFVEQPSDPPSDYEEWAAGKGDYHLSKDPADRATAMIADVKQVAPERPFFTYFCPGVNHAPHQPPKAWRTIARESSTRTIGCSPDDAGLIAEAAMPGKHDADRIAYPARRRRRRGHSRWSPGPSQPAADADQGRRVRVPVGTYEPFASSDQLSRVVLSGC
jgi:arylsulfatase A-like enzyme